MADEASSARYILTVKCPDRKGIVAAIAGFLAEHEASITESPHFDDAIAWRLGPKPEPLKPGEKRSASAGMAGMFGMMNAARLGVGVQGIAIGDVAYQNGYAYAHERRVGHALTGPVEPDQPADLEIVHPDVKRMLLHSRAFVEGARALACWTAGLVLWRLRRGKPADWPLAALATLAALWLAPWSEPHALLLPAALLVCGHVAAQQRPTE